MALDANADDLDTQIHLTATIRPSEGFTANCTFELPVSTPTLRNMFIETFSLFEIPCQIGSVTTVIESPVYSH